VASLLAAFMAAVQPHKSVIQRLQESRPISLREWDRLRARARVTANFGSSRRRLRA